MSNTLARSSPVWQRAGTLPTVGHAHLIGIGGVGMRALANVLEGAGWETSGSDVISALSLPARWRVLSGHAVEHLLPIPDVVVYSPAIARDNVELIAARRLGVPTFSYPQTLGQLMAGRTGIAVAGTHGKSSTAAMTANILHAADLDPTVIVGGTGFQPVRQERPDRLEAYPTLNRYGHGPHVLVEACEYRSSFLHLRPRVAAILGIELDHFDYFISAEHLEQEFARFAELLPSDGVLIASGDCPATRRAVRDCCARVESFGLAHDADWRARIIAADHGRYQFELQTHGNAKCVVQLQVPGLHNVSNALATAALAYHAGVDWNDIQQGLESYSGLQRRLETLGTVGDVTVIDDYAHHPTEITATLAVVRAMHPGRKICCIFEPHQAGRTKRLLDEVAASLQNADTLAVADIYRAREPDWQPGEVTAADLAERARQLGACVVAVHGLRDIEGWLVESWRRGSLAGSVIVTLGAGHIGKLAHGVYDRIRKNIAD